MPPVRIAVIGAGLIGREHVARIAAEPEAELAAIVDPAPGGKALAETRGVPAFADIEGMMSAVEPDGVVIATPNQLHVPHALAAIRAGKPMLLEKPIADTAAEAWRLVEAAETARVPIMVGHHHRHSPAIQRAKRAIEEGRLGRIVAASGITWFLKPPPYFETRWRREKGGGPILINLVHVVDDLRNLMGEIATVQAAGSSAIRGFPVEDTAAVIFTFKSGALATFALSDTAVSPWSWETTSGENPAYPRTGETCYVIAGTEGSLSLPRLELWRHPAEPSWMAPLETVRLDFETADPLALQMRHFCKVIRGEASPLCSGREGALTLEATLAVTQAVASGETVRLG